MLSICFKNFRKVILATYYRPPLRQIRGYMFSALLNNSAHWKSLLIHPVLFQSLEWLQKHATTAEYGDHPLGAPDWYANIHSYQPLAEAECHWENHTRTIDIQYLIAGSEGIRWTEAKELGQPLRYLTDKDRQEFHHCNPPSSLLNMTPGTFAIFMPGEAHCPKIQLGSPSSLRKAVVKIPILLLGKEL